MFSSFFRWIHGWLRVTSESAEPSKIASALSAVGADKGGVHVWDISRVSETALDFSISRSRYRAFREVLREHHCHTRLHIREKHGLFTLLRGLRHRYALVGGFFVLIAAICLLSSIVWTVEITGADKEDEAMIRDCLEQLGLSPGVPSSSVDVRDIKLKLMLAMPKFSYSAINLRGSRAFVQVAQRDDPPEAIYLRLKDPADLIASKPGYILRADTFRGNAKTAAGCTVNTGDVLVSHIVELLTPGTREPTGKFRYVHAQGDIWARTWSAPTVMMPRAALKKSYTGRTYSKNIILFAEKPINIGLGTGIPFAICDRIVERTDLSLFGGALLPFSMITETFLEYTLAPEPVSAERACSILKSIAQEYILSRADRGRIVSASLAVEAAGDAYVLTGNVECEEQIGASAAPSSGKDGTSGLQKVY